MTRMGAFEERHKTFFIITNMPRNYYAHNWNFTHNHLFTLLQLFFLMYFFFSSFFFSLFLIFLSINFTIGGKIINRKIIIKNLSIARISLSLHLINYCSRGINIFFLLLLSLKCNSSDYLIQQHIICCGRSGRGTKNAQFCVCMDVCKC